MSMQFSMYSNLNKAVNIFCTLPEWIRNIQMIESFSTIKTWLRIHNWNNLLFIKGVGVQPSKNWVTLGGGVQIFLQERGDKHEEGRLMQKWHLFYYFTVQSHLLCVQVKFLLLLFSSQYFELATQDSNSNLCSIY